MKFGCIQPLAGGFPIGIEESLGHQPNFVISLPEYWGNDKHYHNYLEENGFFEKEDNIWINLVSESDLSYEQQITKYLGTPTDIDIICSVPLCKGLSTMNTKFGSNQDANKNMIECTRLGLFLKPKIFMFENAPNLVSIAGKPISDILYNIAIENGYNILLFSTMSKFHGDSQRRPRTYAIFTRNDYFNGKTPLFREREIPFVNFRDLLSEIELDDKDPMNFLLNEKKPSEDPWYLCTKYLIELETGKKIETYQQMIEKCCPTKRHLSLKIFCCEEKHNQLSQEFFEKNGYERCLAKCKRAKSNIDQGRNYFSHGIGCSWGEIGAFIAIQLTQLMHPSENRFLTCREALHIMGMPNNYRLMPGHEKETNVIYQNVSPRVVKDLMIDIREWIENPTKIRLDAHNYVVQHKKNNKIEYLEKSEKNSLPDEFFD